MLKFSHQCMELLNNSSELIKVLVPSIITATVSILSIITQTIMSCINSRQLYKNIVIEKKFDSIRQFYQPLILQLYLLENFFKNNPTFKIEKSPDDYTDYEKSFCELKEICKEILNCFKQDDGFFPISVNLTQELLDLNQFMVEVVNTPKNTFTPQKEIGYNEVKKISNMIKEEINNIA